MLNCSIPEVVNPQRDWFSRSNLSVRSCAPLSIGVIIMRIRSVIVRIGMVRIFDISYMHSSWKWHIDRMKMCLVVE